MQQDQIPLSSDRFPQSKGISTAYNLAESSSGSICELLIGALAAYTNDISTIVGNSTELVEIGQQEIDGKTYQVSFRKNNRSKGMLGIKAIESEFVGTESEKDHTFIILPLYEASDFSHYFYQKSQQGSLGLSSYNWKDGFTADKILLFLTLIQNWIDKNKKSNND